MDMAEEKKARVPVQERGIETRRKIIKAGRKLFGERGYFKTNSKEIAREAGVSIGSFYMYFKEKKPLFMEIFRDYYREIGEEVFSKHLPDLMKVEDRREIIE